jgi:hypothetical protein
MLAHFQRSGRPLAIRTSSPESAIIVNAPNRSIAATEDDGVRSGRLQRLDAVPRFSSHRTSRAATDISEEEDDGHRPNAYLRGASGTPPSRTRKFGLRAVAQSAARELGPKNMYVAYLIINTGVDTVWYASGLKSATAQLR